MSDILTLEQVQELGAINGLDFNSALNNLWMEIGDPFLLPDGTIAHDYRTVEFENKFLAEDWEDPGVIPDLLVQVIRDPNYLHFICKYILNLDLLPFQLAILKELWFKPLPILIASRGAGKSFMLAVYLVLRLLLHQGCKICVVGASLRQSMVIYNYCLQIWDSSPILQDIGGGKNKKNAGPKRDQHECHWTLGLSRAVFLPIGTGDKIRGQRANYIISDEFSCAGYETLVETDRGLIKIGDIVENDITCKVLNKDGQWESPILFNKTPLVDTYQVTTKYGYSFKCSAQHKVFTLNGWKLAKDLTKDDHLIFDNKYSFSKEQVEFIDERWAWLLGILVSEGAVTHKNYISIHTTDKPLVDKIKKLFPDLKLCIYENEPYLDPRGWDCKKSYTININNTVLRTQLYDLGLDYVTAHDKEVPWSILQSPRSIIVSFLSGLFDGDGSCFNWNNKDKQMLGVSYYSVSEKLIDQVHILIKKLGYLAYKQPRSSKISQNQQWMLRLNGQYALNFAQELMIEKWQNTIDKSYTHTNENFGTVYCADKKKWRAAPYYAQKTHFIGYYETQEEAVLAVQAWMSEKPLVIPVREVKLLEEKEHLYDFGLPETHSWYGNGFIQHNSLPREIFETVIRGFAAVKSDGVHLNVAQAYKNKVMENLWRNDASKETIKGVGTILSDNQIVLAGTAYYQFNHFYEYFKYYKAIIETGGDFKKLKTDFPDMNITESVDPSKYSIIRLPYDVIPDGMMDKTILSQGRATMDPVIFDMEYRCKFPSDSEGFYLASALHAATCPVKRGNTEIRFGPRNNGSRDYEYVMGIDPASEDDNFAINILEVHSATERRCIYQWTTNRKDFEDLKRSGAISKDIHDYNTFCIRHIRHLLHRFNIQMIVMDSGGGGVSVREGLKDPSKLLGSDDFLIYDMDDEDSKGLVGKHILKMIEFSSYDWRRDSHYGLKSDILNKVLLFPEYDTSEMAVRSHLDEMAGHIHDTMEDSYLEIEQCKQETTLIQHSETSTGKEKWDIPKITGIDADQVKKRLKKDRFSSLLLSNWGARLLVEENDVEQPEGVFGGSPADFKEDLARGNPFVGRGAKKMKRLPESEVFSPTQGTANSDSSRRIFF